MSLAINLDQIQGILLSDGCWYVVKLGSPCIDAYEYLWMNDPALVASNPVKYDEINQIFQEGALQSSKGMSFMGAKEGYLGVGPFIGGGTKDVLWGSYVVPLNSIHGVQMAE